jgi:hypothetical protein
MIRVGTFCVWQNGNYHSKEFPRKAWKPEGRVFRRKLNLLRTSMFGQTEIVSINCSNSVFLIELQQISIF